MSFMLDRNMATGPDIHTAAARYQSIVVRSPSSNEVVRATKAEARSRARVVSSARRGWPSGLVASQRISPVEAGQLGDELDEVADGDLAARRRG